MQQQTKTNNADLMAAFEAKPEVATEEPMAKEEERKLTSTPDDGTST